MLRSNRNDASSLLFYFAKKLSEVGAIRCKHFFYLASKIIQQTELVRQPTSSIFGQILQLIINSRQLNPNMENTHLYEPENNEDPSDFNIFEVYDFKPQENNYFFESQSPLQLNYDLPYDADLQLKDQSQELNFMEPHLTKFTDMTVNETFLRRSSDEKQSLENSQNEVTVKSFLNYDNNQTSKINSVNDLTLKMALPKQQQQFKGVFEEVKIKGRYHKNTNVPKILVRIYIKYFSKYMQKKAFKYLQLSHIKVKEQLLNRQTNNHNISDLLELFNAGSQEVAQANTQSRETMSRIIGSKIKEEIILNNFVKKNKMSYMLALKIYALRCRSRFLTQRVQIM